MIKNRTAIFFIFLANILLSAHVFIPHHHHNNEVCITDIYTEAECEDHKHDSAEDKQEHEHEGARTSDCCVLNPTVIIPSNHLKKECKCFECLDNRSSLYNNYALTYSAGLKTIIPVIVTRIQVTEISPFYIQTVNTSIGLRAPPIV